MGDAAATADGRGEAAGRTIDLLVGVLAALLVAIALGWVTQLPSRLFGAALHRQQFLAAVMVPAVLVVFLKVAASLPGGPGLRPETILKAYLPGLLGAAAFAWIAVDYPSLMTVIPRRTPEVIALSAVIALAVLEGVRRAAGTSLFVIVLAFLGYALVGHMVPGALNTREVAPDRLVAYVSLDLGGLFGSALTVGATIVVLYVLLGNVLLRAGGGQFFTDLALGLTGRQRGGPAKVAVVGSALFGSISGSAVSNVTSTGVLTIPMMVRAGFPARRAGAIEAVASTGGQLTPPIMGAAAFLMAEFLSVPYSTVVLAAAIPAVLYYWAVFAGIDLVAGRDGIRLPEDERLPAGRAVLSAGWPLLVPFAVLFAALFWFREPAPIAALWTIASLLVIGPVAAYGGVRPGLAALWEAVTATGRASADLLMILAGAGLIIGVLNVTGLGFAMTLALLDLAAGSVLLLLAVAAIACVVLGMGMPTTGVYVLLATLVAPALVRAGVEPVAAHMFVLYFGLMSMITPPVAIAAFAAASLSGEGAMRTGVEAMRVGWVAYVIPFMFAAAPALVMAGPPHAVAVSTVTAAAGIWFISLAAVGWWNRPLSPPVRAGFAACGIATMVPDQALGLPPVADGLGLLAGLSLAVLLHRAAAR